MKMPTGIDLIARVRAVLEDSARAKKTITFGEIERRVGLKIGGGIKFLTPFTRTVGLKGMPT